MTSQDTLVAHLRTTHICPSRECEAAADALEAQAARITELEAAIRAALHRATLRNEPDPELEDVLNGDSDA